MHNIDRTVGESSYELNNENYELNNEFGYEDEFLNELNGTSGESNEYSGEYSGGYSNEAGYGNELSGEAMEMELATELLGVSNEAQMEQFLGSLIKKAAGAVKSFANSSAGRAVGGFLRAAAKKALPVIGGAAGTFLGGPAGAAIGGKLGSMASNLFEMEMEGLSNEDKEYELSRAYVRFANAAVRNAVRSPLARRNPRLAARNAVVSAARMHAPGLLRRRSAGRRQVGSGVPSYAGYNAGNDYGNTPGADDGSQQQGSGTWYREGNQIIINL